MTRPTLRSFVALHPTATSIALTSLSERTCFDVLTALSGVSAPMASAILTLTNPRRYGVIDIRAWKVLFRLGAHGACFDMDAKYARMPEAA